MEHNSQAVSNFMTPMPYTMRPDATLDEALRLMESYKIHHLPITSDGHITGVLSQQDIHLIRALPEQSGSLGGLLVKDAMSLLTYSVSPQTPISLVAAHMADHQLSAALVVQDTGQLLGIFTVHDALYALAHAMHSRLWVS